MPSRKLENQERITENDPSFLSFRYSTRKINFLPFSYNTDRSSLRRKFKNPSKIHIRQLIIDVSIIRCRYVKSVFIYKIPNVSQRNILIISLDAQRDTQYTHRFLLLVSFFLLLANSSLRKEIIDENKERGRKVAYASDVSIFMKW